MTSPSLADPYAPAPSAAPQLRGGTRALATAVALYLGGYLLIQSLTGQLPAFLTGIQNNGPAVIALLLGQFLFALLVVVIGIFLAPAPAATKLIASLVAIVPVVGALMAMVVRLSSGMGGATGIPFSMTLANPFFMVVLGVGAAWLVVRSARAGWVALAGAAVLIPLPFLFVFNGVEFAVMQIVVLAIAALVGLGILAAGRPLR